jgi:thioredoxin reductase (NADPH)
MLIPKGRRLVCDSRPYVVEVENGARIPARTIVIATGAEYRRPACENLSRLEGAGVYYAATFVEAQLCGGDEVIVVGGGNSAGQAAVFLAETAKRVHMLVRSASLAESMSRYLIRRIEETHKIVFWSHTEIIALQGGDHLESVRWRNNRRTSSSKANFACLIGYNAQNILASMVYKFISKPQLLAAHPPRVFQIRP